jgi:hypothetical protein
MTFTSSAMNILRLRWFPALILAFSSAMGALEATEVVLRNKDGKSLTVRLVSITGDKLGVMRESDKKHFTLDITQLDDASRSKVAEWVKAGGNMSERYAVDVSTGKSSRNNNYDYDDERIVSMEPIVLVKNPDINIPTKAAKVTALLLGRPVNERNGYYVFSNETFDLPSLEGGKQKALPMKKFRHSYDDRGSYKFGARYLGWVVLIHDPVDKRIIHSQSLPAPLVGKFGEKFLKLQPRYYYDSELDVIKYTNSYQNFSN